MILILLVDAFFDIFISYFLLALLLFTSHQEDLELGLELIFQHSLVTFHVSVFLSHASVEELVEINIAFLAVDGHFQKLFFELVLVVEFLAEAETGLLITILSQVSEEFFQLALLNLMASVLVLSKPFPHDHEALQISLKFGYHIFLWQIILFELLYNDQHEQVQHDV